MLAFRFCSQSATRKKLRFPLFIDVVSCNKNSKIGFNNWSIVPALENNTFFAVVTFVCQNNLPATFFSCLFSHQKATRATVDCYLGFEKGRKLARRGHVWSCFSMAGKVWSVTAEMVNIMTSYKRSSSCNNFCNFFCFRFILRGSFS